MPGWHPLGCLAADCKRGLVRAQWDKTAWQALLEPTDACFGAVLSPPEAAEHPHMRARGVYVEQDGTLQAVPAPRFDGEAYAPGAPCAPGAHTQLVREQLAAQGAKAVWRP